MKLHKIREIMFVFESFKSHEEQGCVLIMKFIKGEEECIRTFKTINDMTMDENLNLRVDCQSDNGEKTVFTFNKKATDEKKISDLSILISLNGKNFLEYRENTKEKNGE